MNTESEEGMLAAKKINDEWEAGRWERRIKADKSNRIVKRVVLTFLGAIVIPLCLTGVGAILSFFICFYIYDALRNYPAGELPHLWKGKPNNHWSRGRYRPL